MDSVENLAAILNETSQNLPVDELYVAAEQVNSAAATLAHDADESLGVETMWNHLDTAHDRVLAAASSLILAQDRIRDYLLDIGAEAGPGAVDHAISMQEIPPVPRGPITELWEGTTLTAAEVRSVLEDLNAGKAVRSTATAIGAIGITDKELAHITRRDVGYRRIDDGTGFLPGIVLDKNVRAAIARIRSEFIALCQQDVDRGGLGVIDMSEPFEIRLGQFDQHNQLRWHVDLFRRPAIRYVVSFGTGGATEFGDMLIRKSDIGGNGYLNAEAATRVRPFNHGPGVVSRFLGDSGVHNTPPDSGRRLFMTLTAMLRD